MASELAENYKRSKGRKENWIIIHMKYRVKVKKEKPIKECIMFIWRTLRAFGQSGFWKYRDRHGQAAVVWRTSEQKVEITENK